ncbi:transporter [Plantactinospora sp. KBS50]|nr:transporter [Plantactinospora sp. KBS50]
MYLVLPLLPDMARDLGIPVATATWTTTAFGLAYAGGFLVTGPLSDLYGRRRIIVVGLGVLTAATAAGALASGLPFLLACRIVQGLGAAGLSPVALAYLGERIAPRRRSIAVTMLVTAMIAATVTGQVTGQILLPLAGWRGTFLVNAGMIAALAVAIRLVLSGGRPQGAPVGPRAFLAAAGRLLTRPLLLLIYLAALTVLGSFVAVYTALQLLGPPQLTDAPGAMLALRASSLPVLVAVPLLAPVLNRVRPTLRAALALVVGAAAVGVLAVQGAAAPLVTGGLMFVFVGAIGAVSPGLTEQVAALSGPARGAGVALYTFSLITGASLGPQLVTALAGGGLTAPLAATGVVQLAGAGILLLADRYRSRQEAAELG